MKNGARGIHHCRVCGSASTVHLCDTYCRHVPTATLGHFRCDQCGSAFIGNDVRSEELSAAYSGLDTRGYYEEIDAPNRKKMAAAIRHLKDLVSQDRSVIDIGTGNGMFLEFLDEAGFSDVSAHEIEGSDLSRVEGIASRIFKDFDYSTIPSNQFDAVTLLDVAEHVVDPRYLIRTCNRILRTGGVVYLHTPVVTRTDRMMHSLQRLPLLRKVATAWQTGRTSIYHLENYTPKALAILLEGAGFYDIQIEVKNELSWPVTKYIRTYLLRNRGLGGLVVGVLSAMLYPFLATNVFNANKAIVSARKARSLPREQVEADAPLRAA